MKNSTHALLVLTPNTRDHGSLLRAAKEVLSKKAKLTILYITPKVPAVAHHVPEIAVYAQVQEDMGRSVLEEVGQTLSLSSENLILRSGHVKHVTKSLAKEINAKVILADFASWQSHQAGYLISEIAQSLGKLFVKWLRNFNTTPVIGMGTREIIKH